MIKQTEHLSKEDHKLLDSLVSENTKMCKQAKESLNVNGKKFIDKLKNK